MTCHTHTFIQTKPEQCYPKRTAHKDRIFDRVEAKHERICPLASRILEIHIRTIWIHLIYEKRIFIFLKVVLLWLWVVFMRISKQKYAKIWKKLLHFFQSFLNVSTFKYAYLFVFQKRLICCIFSIRIYYSVFYHLYVHALSGWKSRQDQLVSWKYTQGDLFSYQH